VEGSLSNILPTNVTLPLKSVNVSGWFIIKEIDFSKFIGNCKKTLEELHIIEEFSYDLLEEIFNESKFKCLKTLSIAFNSFSPTINLTLLPFHVNHCIENLTLTNIPFDHDNYSGFFKKFPNIKHLKLTSSTNLHWDEWSSISCSMTKLESLYHPSNINGSFEKYSLFPI
jgi:hypothetical protein